QKKHDALLGKVNDIERAIRSIKLGEDLNRNGRLDEDEDLNENGKLDSGPDPKKYTPYQRNLGRLYESVTLYDQLKNALYPNAQAKLFGPSYENDLAVLALRKELRALGALENEELAMEALRKKPEVLQRIKDFQTSEAFLRGQSRFAPFGIVPPRSFDGTVGILNGNNEMKASGGNLKGFLKPQDQVKIGSYSAFHGIWRENQLREKLIKSVDNDESATLANLHEGRFWLIDACFYLAFAGIAYGIFRSLRKRRNLQWAGIVGLATFAGLACVWQVLFGTPSATIENAPLHHIDWTTLPDSLLETRGQSENADAAKVGKIDPYVQAYADLATAYKAGGHTQFNGIVDKLNQDFATVAPTQWHDLKNIGPEHLFNGAQPFVTCMALYLVALVLVFVSWLIWPETLGKSALGIAVVALALHSLALVARIWIQGRPPVTNLYSSAIFISWGAVCFGLLFERLYRNGIGTAAATIVGFVSLLIAHNLAMDGDTMEMLQAVLDTNLWLATHVVCITLGYVAMFVAGILAILYVLRGLLDHSFDKQTAGSVSSMIYGVACFAVLFSFVGTMLGGIWADDSWGRFWGWDPKENGAILIVIWSAIVLHARWGGLAKDRGIAALAIGGNIVTAWSWFGTNLLQEGLHSYGFSDSGFLWLMRFIGLQIFFIAIACIPLRFWRSEIGEQARTA
ncbi:MAG: cytochrome c biogenesis protein CcsA, partial [Opitutales bacterium]